MQLEDMTTGGEKNHIWSYFKAAIDKLKPCDREIEQIKKL